jgi:FMN reductase [NAD(P)H]
MFGGISSESDKGLLYPKVEEKEDNISLQDIDDALQTNIFNIMLSRRSQRKFENKEVEDSKVEMILAAADTAPTAGGFQGFEIYNVKNPEIKLRLVDTANKQPYVNAPVVLVFCMNPTRVKMNFPPNILKKFSLQDAQLAAHALGLSSVWIGMIDEEKVMAILGTKYTPSSILCLGYPQKILQPKPKRSLIGLIHEI